MLEINHCHSAFVLWVWIETLDSGLWTIVPEDDGLREGEEQSQQPGTDHHQPGESGNRKIKISLSFTPWQTWLFCVVWRCWEMIVGCWHWCTLNQRRFSCISVRLSKGRLYCNCIRIIQQRSALRSHIPICSYPVILCLILNQRHLVSLSVIRMSNRIPPLFHNMIFIDYF